MKHAFSLTKLKITFSLAKLKNAFSLTKLKIAFHFVKTNAFFNVHSLAKLECSFFNLASENQNFNLAK